MEKTGPQTPDITTYTVLSAGFWRAYLITMRPYLLFISGSAGLVGMAFVEKDLGLKVIAAFIPLFLSYGLGQALTDCFQTDTDAISAPYRPLVKGIISKGQVLTVSLIGLFICVLILGYLNSFILILGIFTVAGLLTYTFFKRQWWGGPPWNSWIVALLAIIGRYVDPEFHITGLSPLQSMPFLFSIFAVFFAYANFVVMGYLKDISADRRTGYNTFPVVFGWRPTAIYSDITALLAATFTALVLYLSEQGNVWSVGFFIIAAGVNLFAQVKIHIVRDEEKTHGPIVNTVRSFILYCLAIITTYKLEWLIWMGIFYLVFELALKIRPEKKQV